MKSAYDIVKAPILTEKSYDYIAHRVYTFEVAKTANKIEIAKAIEEIFDVKVQSVHTVNQLGKIKRQGRYEGRRPSTKKAYVKLTNESRASSSSTASPSKEEENGYSQDQSDHSGPARHDRLRL